MTLYLKYRSQTLEDLDSELVRETLKKTVAAGDIPHAFLFSGPKGTGKTSAARILAKIIDCEERKEGKIEPCNKCDTCISITKGSNIDVIEIDAASHRGIDDIRSLREAVKLSPARAKKKIYIIDEAHMLTLEASNALLKTLEEPPDHVVFILATTNPEKLIDTIRSRTVEVNFKKAGSDEIKRSLKRIAGGEKIKIPDNVAEVIAENSKGSFRDSHKLLEQLLSSGVDLTNIESVEKVLVGFRPSQIDTLIDLIVKEDINSAISEIESVAENGVSINLYIDSIISLLHRSLLSKVGIGEDPVAGLSKDDLIILFELLVGAKSLMRDSVIEQVPLESALIKFIDLRKKDNKSGSDNGNITEVQDDIGHEEKQTAKTTTKKIEINNSNAFTDSENNGGEEVFIREIDENIWNDLLRAVKPKNTSTEALLRAAKPIGFDGKILKLGVYYSFHKERLEERLHTHIVETTVEEIMGTPVRIMCQLTEAPQKTYKEVRITEEVPNDLDKSAATLTEVGDEAIIKLAKEVFERG